MEDIYSRTTLIIGDEALEKLKNATVAVFGIGGVGSYTVEALARAGIGHLILIDSDHVSKSLSLIHIWKINFNILFYHACNFISQIIFTFL